jgi:isopentenyl diphosphate isomerase/L-lactate dehydrogenase-like FMN-dependent dehydrogenase
MPLAMCSTGIVGLVSFEGEIAAARAGRQAEIPYGLSTSSISSVEDVARHTDGDLWFQLSVWHGEIDLTFDLVKRAKNADYRVLIVLTVGAAVVCSWVIRRPLRLWEATAQQQSNHCNRVGLSNRLPKNERTCFMIVLMHC